MRLVVIMVVIVRLVVQLKQVIVGHVKDPARYVLYSPHFNETIFEFSSYLHTYM